MVLSERERVCVCNGDWKQERHREGERERVCVIEVLGGKGWGACDHGWTTGGDCVCVCDRGFGGEGVVCV